MLVGGDLGFLARVVVTAFVVLFAPVVGFVVRRKWRRSVARREEIKRLLVLASEETARAELEATSEFGYGGYSYGSEVEVEVKAEAVDDEEEVEVPTEVEIRVPEEAAKGLRRLQYQCEVCFSPTTTRCAQCKAVHYCSGKCQIIHWRKGHKDECRPFAISDQSDDIDGTHLNSLTTKGNESYHRSVEVEGRHPDKLVEISSREAAILKSNLPRLPNGNDNNEVGHCIDEKESGFDHKFVAYSIFKECSGVTFSNGSSVNGDASVSDLNNQNLLDRHQSVHRVLSYTKTERANAGEPKQPFPEHSVLVGSIDNIATALKSDLIKPNSVDVYGWRGSSTSSVSSVDGCNESSFSEPSTPSSGFWEGTINTSRTRIDAFDDTTHSCSDEGADFDILDSRSSSCCSSELAGTVLPSEDVPVTCSRKEVSYNLHPSKSEIKKPSTLLPSSVEASKDGLKSQRSSMSSEKFDHVDVGNLSTRRVSISRESRDLLSCKDNKASDLLSSSSDKLKSRVEDKISVSQEPKSAEFKSFSSSVSDGNLSSSTGKHTMENVNSMKIDKIDTTHMAPACSSDSFGHLQNARTSSKASVWKVVDQLKASKLARLNPIGIANESVGRYSNKGLFPYELFVKLYTLNKVELQPCGLMNCGNSCYANAVLQCLAFTPPLTAYFLQGLHSKGCKKKDWCFTCEFESLVLKAKEGKSPLSPSRIISQLQSIGSHLGNGREEDAHEFLRYAIDTMQSVCLKEAGISMSVSLEETTLIGLTFGGYLRSKIECMRCGGKSERHEKMMDLTVEIEGDIGTLEEALRQFTHTETLDGENKYHCSRCKSYEKARKKLRVLEAPNVLTIALKRFQSGKFGKLNKTIKFPEILDLAPYMSGTSDKSPIYRLYGVVVHLDIMNAAFSGHYVCYVKNTQNKWFKIDDSMVKSVELERVLTKGAYMLLYARCSPRAPRLIRSSLNSHDPRKSKHEDCQQRYRSRGPWDVPISDSSKNQNSDDCFCPNHASLHPIRIVLEEDSSSENSSSFFSEVKSCSTDSSNMDSVITDDYFDQIFGDMGVCWSSPLRNSSDSETSSSSSSPSPMYSRHLPVADLEPYASRYSERNSSCNDAAESASGGRAKFPGNNGVKVAECKGSSSPPFLCPDSSTKYCRKVGSSNSCRENGSSKIGWINPFDKKSNVSFRRSMRESSH